MSKALYLARWVVRVLHVVLRRVGRDDAKVPTIAFIALAVRTDRTLDPSMQGDVVDQAGPGDHKTVCVDVGVGVGHGAVQAGVRVRGRRKLGASRARAAGRRDVPSAGLGVSPAVGAGGAALRA